MNLGVAFLTIAGSAAFVAQAQAPSFEVASIKLNRSGERLKNRFQFGQGGSFVAGNCSLIVLINWAFDVLESHVSGAPGWLKSDGYDIAAKAGSDSHARDFQAMVRELLEDRFQLKYHWETKEAPVYNLVVRKAGKLKENRQPGCSGSFPDTPCGGLRNTPGDSKGNKMTASELAGSLSFFMQRPVLDKTGLTGRYDIELQWTPERVEMQASPPPEVGAPSIFTALQEQLGLKLESAKAPVKILVIDHVERPSEN